MGDLVSNARSKVLDLQTREADPAADAEALRRLALWALRYSPVVSPWDAANGADGLFIDIAGAAHLFGGEAALLADLGRRLTAFGLAPRLAVADTAGTAWAMARHGRHGSDGGDGGTGHAIVPSGEEGMALATLPLAALRLPEATLSLLGRLGFRRIGALIDAPRAPLAARFEALLLRLDQALGHAPEPLVPAVPPPVYGAQATFAEPIVSQEHILEAATRLLQPLVADLERDGAGARSLRLLLFHLDGCVHSVEIGLAAPSRDARHIARLIALRLERTAAADALDAALGFEAAALHVPVAEPLEDHQARLSMDEAVMLKACLRHDQPEALAQLVDRLQQRLGPRAVRRLHPHPSHIPERAVRAGPPSPRLRGEGRGEGQWQSSTPFGQGQGKGRVTPTSASVAAPHPSPLPASGERESGRRLGRWIADTTRPLLLLPRPEPAEVVALIPEGPPRQFRWRGVRHQVAHAEGPERIAPEWWHRIRGDTERDYYMVEDLEGRRFWLYRAGRYGSAEAPPPWFIHGVFA